MLTEEEFITYYNAKKKLPLPVSYTGNKILNEKQLHSKYLLYVKKIEHQLEKRKSIFEDEDSEYISSYIKKIFQIEAECFKENPNAEEFYTAIQKYDEINHTTFVAYFKKMNMLFGNVYDPAHIIPRSQSTALAISKLNIIIMPRFVHSNLDEYREIFDVNHKTIDRKRHEEIWKIIVGEERYNTLLDIKKYT